jgi:ABC-type polysaccharide/polyol phosphate export permease
MANLTGGIKTYTPTDRFEVPFWKTWIVVLRNILRSRDLIRYLYLKDMFAKYRKSFFGSIWFIFSPLLGVVSWVFLNYTGLIDPGDLEVPYVVYVLVGTSMWQFYMNIYRDASGTLITNTGIISQIHYPHEALYVQKVLITLTNFGVTFLINLVVILIFGVNLSWKIVFFPLVMIPLILLGSALGLIAALLGVVVVDLRNVMNILMGLVLWITPVVYSTKLDSPLMQAIIPWNPLTYLISSARDIVVAGSLYEPKSFFICAGLSLVFFLISLRLFWVSENRLIERLI